MKKLGKLQINSEKVIKNEELVLLKGGYGEPGDPGTCGYKIWLYNHWQIDCEVNHETILWLKLLYPDAEMYWCCDNCGSSSYCS